MAQILTLSDLKQERKRIENAIELLPLSPYFSEQEKEDILIILNELFTFYDVALSKHIEVVAIETVKE